METPPADASAQQTWSSESARLFLQAAEGVCPQLQFGDELAPTVASICRHLDGIPLALELAAAQLQVLSPEQLLSLLQRRLRLALGTRRQVPRQQTLRAVVRWSVENLAKHEQQTLCALAVCAGGCDFDAARAIVNADICEEALIASLAHLADRALITVRHVSAGARYYLLETVRDFVLDTLASSSTDQLEDRHHDHYLQLAENMRPQLQKFSERARALDLLDLERENMGRAIDWGVTARRWTTAARLVHALLPYWSSHGWVGAGLELALTVTAVADPEVDPACATRLLNDAASLATRVGQLARARSLATAAAKVANRAGLVEAEIDALGTYILVDLLDGEPSRIVPVAQSLLERAAEARLSLQQSRLLSFLGQAYMELGDFDAARATLERSRHLALESSNPMGAAVDTLFLALASVLAADATRARRLLLEVARGQPQIDHHIVASYILFNVACLARLEGQWGSCLRAHLAASRYFESGGIADNRFRRREREEDVARAREALDTDTQEALEHDVSTGSLSSHLAWAVEYLSTER